MPTSAVPTSIVTTRDESFPLIARLEAPGPFIVRFFLIKSGPVVSAIVPLTVTLIVSPGNAMAIASRKEPGPLSNAFVTGTLLPKAGNARRRLETTRPDRIALLVIYRIATLGSHQGVTAPLRHSRNRSNSLRPGRTQRCAECTCQLR